MDFRSFLKACIVDLHSLREYRRKNRFFIGVALIALTACGTIFGALFVHFFWGINIPAIAVVNQGTASYWGQLGDFAGGFLNPLLSFLALMAVLKTMALQRAEMKAAQLEAKTATQEQRQQTAVYSKQMFESTLFGMLDVHAKILGDIKHGDQPGRARQGRDAIDMIVKDFKEGRKYQAGIFYPESVVDSSIQSEIEVFCNQWLSVSGHYFRNLYWIMKMIDTSQDIPLDFKGDEALVSSKRRFYTDYLRKRNYANIVRAQLSQSEMALLQINCLGSYGADLKYYVEKYSLLKPLGKKYFGAWSAFMSSEFNSMAFFGLEDVDVDALMKMRVDRVARNTSAIRKKT